MSVGLISADARQLFTGKHIDYSSPADARLHHDETGMIGHDRSDGGRILASKTTLTIGLSSSLIRRSAQGLRVLIEGVR
jgi:hypothetical protein